MAKRLVELPYRPAFEKYWVTLYFRFSERAIRRHRAALSRGLINRELRKAA
jgi:hypothetical protein